MKPSEPDQGGGYRRIRVRLRRDEAAGARRIRPAVAVAIVVLSALLGVAIGIGAGRIFRRILKIQRDQAGHAEERRTAFFTPPPESPQPSASDAEGL